jgi:hypothetical protein
VKTGRVNQLYDAHKFKASDYQDIDWNQMELLLDVFPQSTFDSLKANFLCVYLLVRTTIGIQGAIMQSLQ